MPSIVLAGFKDKVESFPAHQIENSHEQFPAHCVSPLSGG